MFLGIYVDSISQFFVFVLFFLLQLSVSILRALLFREESRCSFISVRSLCRSAVKMMSPMPFLSGPVEDKQDAKVIDHCEPWGELESLIPLSKPQQALWLDYRRRPSSCHYNLTLRIDLSDAAYSLESILWGKLFQALLAPNPS